MLSFVFTRSDCHLTIITLNNWIKIDKHTVINDQDWQLSNCPFLILPYLLHNVLSWLVYFQTKYVRCLNFVPAQCVTNLLSWPVIYWTSFWIPDLFNCAGYIIEKKPRDSDSWQRVNDILAVDNKFLVPDLVEGSDMEFRIIAVNAAGNSEPSPACSPVKIKEKIGTQLCGFNIYE